MIKVSVFSVTSVKVCPYNGESRDEINQEKHNLYMVKSKDEEVLYSSSSGEQGMKFLKCFTKGYDVVGCVYDKEKRESVHKMVLAGDVGNLNVFKARSIFRVILLMHLMM